MNTANFITAYNESRNGCNERIRHPLARQLVYSDGVQELAEAGAYWLLDIIGTEHVPAFRRKRDYFEGMGFIYVVVADSKATITLAKDEGEPPVHVRKVEFTDMPEGQWTFYLTDEMDHFFLFLPTEY